LNRSATAGTDAQTVPLSVRPAAKNAIIALTISFAVSANAVLIVLVETTVQSAANVLIA